VISKWLLLSIGLYGASLLYLYLTQESSIFNSKSATFEPFTCKGCERVTLSPQSGVELVGKARLSKSSKLLLYFGGNADDASAILKYLNPDLDMQVVAFNYRGYGESSGKPSQEAFFSDALAIYDTYAKDKEVIIMGRSLGTGVATYLASKRPATHVVLITPFDSIRAIAKAKYPYFPIDWLIRHPFESIKYTPQIEAKISVVEVSDDKVVPNIHTANLLKTISNLFLHVKLENITHGEVLRAIDFNVLLKKLQNP
jgi:hypothetical protein